MIPKVTRGGSSFKGAFQYYLHDKDGDSTERVAWTQTENMRTDDPDKAWRVMAYTAREQERLKEASGQSRAGRKLEKPVFAYSLAWHPEQKPSPEHMLETARSSLEMLGLTEHEAIIVAHDDEPQKHVHVIVNRVHPITGLAGDVRNSKRKFSDFAREYERQHGKIYCERREENARKRETGETTHYGDPVILKAWETSRNGREFVAALEREGYTLAQGRKRPVIVDLHGKAHNPTRQLRGVKAKVFRERLADLDLEKLPTVEDVAEKTAKRDADLKERMEVFEHVVGIQLKNMATSHKDERDKFKLRYRYRLASEREQLIAHYRLREQKEAIKAQAAKIRRASWWQRLLGLTRKDQQQLNGQILSFKSARHRYQEQLQSVIRKRGEDFVRLRTIQQRELEQLQNNIERERKLERYSIRVQPHPRDRRRSHDRDGIGYER